MRYLPFCDRPLHLFLSMVVLFGVFSLPAVSQDAPDEPQPPADPQAKPETPPKPSHASKRDSKYDVDRIGQRGIGRGANLYSLDRERALGESMARSIDSHNRFFTDSLITDYINGLGQKIARNSDSELPFTIKVIDSPDTGIFGLPGGFLYVDKGLILSVENEAELAGLMAHEIAHVAARHFTRAASRMYEWNLFSTALAFGGPVGLGLREVGGIALPLSMKKSRRDAELEADLLAVEYEYAAGYDPEAFVRALERLSDRELVNSRLSANTSEHKFAQKMPLHAFFSRAFASYPPTPERIQKIQQQISALLPPRNDYVVDSSDFQEVRAKLTSGDMPTLRRHRAGEGNQAGPVLRRTRPDDPPREIADNQIR